MKTFLRFPLAACLLAMNAPILAAAPTWYVVRGGFFDLYANSGKREAVDAAVWIEQFRRTVGTLWKVESGDISRATIIQFRSRRDFEPYAMGTYNGGYFVRSQVQSLMVYHEEGEVGAMRSLVQHEAVHWLLASKRGRLPTWLNEGVAEVYSTFSLRGDACRIFEADAANILWLRANGINALDALLAREQDELDFEDRDKVREFYAQAWALTHFFVAGQKGAESSAAIPRYVALIQAGIPARQAFEQAFGMTTEAMRRELNKYVHNGRYTMLTVKFPREELRARYSAEPASPVEVACILARATLVGRDDPDRAESQLRQARDTWPDSPLPYEGLGTVANWRGDHRAAAEMFAAAAERGSQHACAYSIPASDELHDRLGMSPTRRELRAGDARRLSDALIKALELDRNLRRAAYDLGQALLFTDPLKKSDVQFLASMETSAEDPLVVRYRLAGLLYRLGDPRARATLESLAQVADNPLLSAAAKMDLEAMESTESDVVVGARYVLKLHESKPGLSTPIRRPPR